jgi:hypothetical protein
MAATPMRLLTGNGPLWLGVLLLVLAVTLLVLLWRMAGAEDRRRAAQRRRHRDLHLDLDQRLSDVETYLFGDPPPAEDDECPN